jgi:hypothetical protein
MAEHDDEPVSFDLATMLAAAQEIVSSLEKQLIGGAREVMLTRDAGVLTLGFINALIDGLERGAGGCAPRLN